MTMNNYYSTTQIAIREMEPGYFYTVELSKLFSCNEDYADLVDLYSLVGHYNGNIRILGTFDDKDKALFFLEHMAH